MISAAQRKSLPLFPTQPLFIVCMVTLSGIALAVFQDYLFTLRHNSPFVFYESLLFKCVWGVFIVAYACSFPFFDKIKQLSYPKLFGLYTALVFCHFFLSTGMVWTLSWIGKEQGYGFAKILVFTFSNDSTKILLIYFISIAYIKKFHLPKSNINIANTQHKSLQIKNGKQYYLVNFDAIVCIKADSPYVIVQTEEHSYLHSASLKRVAGELDARFIKLHRSCIVNIDKVTAYHSRLNGDYDVHLSGDIKVRLSRNYAKQFKAVIDKALLV